MLQSACWSNLVSNLDPLVLDWPYENWCLRASDSSRAFISQRRHGLKAPWRLKCLQRKRFRRRPSDTTRHYDHSGACLKNFGELFPRTRPGDLMGETLYTSRLSFFSLDRLSGVRVKWVDVLSVHLEFNVATKELMVFRFPPFCIFYSRRVRQESVLHR